jgi:hypothetical protein
MRPFCEHLTIRSACRYRAEDYRLFSFIFFDRYSVVDSVDGDQHRAVDALLAMSDPDHVPAHQAAANEQQPSQVRPIITIHPSICCPPRTRLTFIAHTLQRLNKPSWTRNWRAGCCSKMSSSMPATRSRCDSNRSKCANSLMRSAPTRRSIAVILRSNSNSLGRSSVIRCRTCRSNLVNLRKVRSFPASPGLGRDSVRHRLWAFWDSPHRLQLGLTVMPSPLHIVAGKRTFSSFVSKVKAKVQEYDQQRYARIFSLFACYPPPPLPLLFALPQPRAKEGGEGRGAYRSRTHSYTGILQEHVRHLTNWLWR